MGPARRFNADARPLSLLASQAIGGVVLIVAAAVLPWATYKIGSESTHLDAGRIEGVLIAAGAVAIGFAATSWFVRSRRVAYAELVVGLFALALTIATALVRIGDANSVTNLNAGPTPTSTSFGIGSGLGLLAALAILIPAIEAVARLRRR